MISEDAAGVASDPANLDRRFYPETAFGGFTRVDGTIHFYTRIAALLTQDSRVLDFGAGRGGHILTDDVAFRRRLRDLKKQCANVTACDVDPVVMTNPFADEKVVIQANGPLPFKDGEFDLIVANFVLEHVEFPAVTASELLRITKPGGFICAMTPNKWGYVAIAARLIKNRFHQKFLKTIQPDRVDIDIFPTMYRLNTRSSIHKHFASGGRVAAYTHNPEPAYHFKRRAIYAIQKMLHGILPSFFGVTWMIFVQKHG